MLVCICVEFAVICCCVTCVWVCVYVCVGGLSVCVLGVVLSA